MKQSDTFDPSFFEKLKRVEENHFWFRVRRKWIYDRIRKFYPPPAGVLEVGCGTGNVSSFLAEKGYAVTGCEIYDEAIQLSWPGFRKIQGDIHELPFEDNSFEILGLFDVIEHCQDDVAVLRESIRVVKKEGLIVLTVPAWNELWSGFDEIACHKRRYTKEMLKLLFSEANLRPLSIEYMFMSLYLPMKYIRSESRKDNDPFKINRLVNTLLKGLFDMERIISKRLPLPIGTSLIAVARKKSLP